jgi:hypothetical protein
MKKMALLALTLFLLFDASAAWAQRRGGASSYSSNAMAHKFELVPYGGYLWSVSRSFTYLGTPGEVDFKSGGIWGAQLNVNIRPGGQLQLLYQRQDTDLIFRSGFPSTETTLFPSAIEYYQIGGVGGLMQGNIFPFSKFTLGATRFAPGDPVDPDLIEELDGASLQDAWRFSIILGLGVKAYLSEKIALSLEGTLPFTFFSAGAGLGIGTGGAGVYVGGSGLTQFKLSLGLAILLGTN